MFRYIIYIIIFHTYLLSIDNLFEGVSETTIIDFVDPEVNLITPNGGEGYQNQEYASILWDASDQFGIMDNGIDLELSITHMPEQFNEFFYDLDNTYNTAVLFNNINTQYAKIKIIAYDSYGNSSEDVSDQYFMIGEPDILVDQSLLLTGYSNPSTLDFVNPQIDFTFQENAGGL